MRYFRIKLLGDEYDGERVFVDQRPLGLDGWDFCMAQGERIGDKYPPDAKVFLNDRYPGIKLTDFVSNSVCYLIVSQRMMEIVRANANVDIEYLPLAIFNHRKRPHASDYWIVNPIGTTDCLDRERSVLLRGEETGEITFVEQYAFRAEPLRASPPSILRVKETPWEYFVDEATARAFHGQRLSNILIDIVPVE
jgi:hypothetical protein